MNKLVIVGVVGVAIAGLLYVWSQYTVSGVITSGWFNWKLGGGK